MSFELTIKHNIYSGNCSKFVYRFLNDHEKARLSTFPIKSVVGLGLVLTLALKSKQTFVFIFNRPLRHSVHPSFLKAGRAGFNYLIYKRTVSQTL